MKTILLAAFTTSAFAASAQTPVLVHDLIPGAVSSSPTMTTVFNNKLYYVANDGTNGRELMVWDGTNMPSLVYNTSPGNADAFNIGSGSYNTKMAVFNGNLYFGADNGTTGSELMVYDGTNPPVLAAEINAGSTGSFPFRLHVSGGKLYFNAYSTTANYELFVYDGVNAPVMFDLNPGSDIGDPYYFVTYNGKIYFKANNATAGTELFVYDPANNTAVLAADIVAGAGSSSPARLMVHGNKIYFTATTAAFGRELYSYDGTTATRLTDINSGPSNSIGSDLVSYNNQVYFGASASGSMDQLYKYDPGTNIASLVYNINPGGSSEIRVFEVYGNKLYFNAASAASGDELWVHNGTTTTIVADINPGAIGSDLRDFVIFGDKLCFAASNASTGSELYSFTDSSLSVQNIKLDGAIALMPNPTSENTTLQLSLNSPALLNIQLADVSGKVIWNNTLKNYPAGKTDIIIPVSEQAAGIYFYSATDNSGRMMASGKLVKQ